MPELELYLVTLKLYRHQANAGRPVANPWAGAVGNVTSSYGKQVLYIIKLLAYPLIIKLEFSG